MSNVTDNVPDDVVIRRLRDDEAPALCALANEIWRAHYPGIISVAQIEYMLRQRYTPAVIGAELTQHDIGWDVLLLNNVTTGYTSYFPEGTPCTLKIDKLYLHPRAQRLGLGRRLIAHVERVAAACGDKRLMLAVNKRNFSAITAYHRHGFRIVESVTRAIGMGYEMDDYFMIKSVSV